MISTHSARIEVDTGRGSDRAWADVGQMCSGYVAKITFTPDFGGSYWLAHHRDDHRQRALILAPAEQWAGDVTGEGRVLDQKITSWQQHPATGSAQTA